MKNSQHHGNTISVSRAELIDMVITMISSGSPVFEYDDDEITRVREKLNKMSSELLDRIVASLSMRGTRTIPLVRLITSEADVSEISEYVYFKNHLGDIFSPRVPMLIRGLHSTEQLPEYKDYSRAPQSVKDQCVALMLATEYLYSSNPNGLLVPHNGMEYHITDDALVELILDHYTDIELIISAFDEGRTSVDSVRGYLDNPASALATGTL